VETERTRRLEFGEEERLLREASPHLRAVIVAALTTGCRLGELLSLQWSQVRRDDQGEARQLVFPASRTKTNTARVLPLSTRLRAELDLRRTAPDGNPYAADDHVFGDVAGRRVKSINTAWRATCRRAGTADLHFHDLRREFRCRLLESGARLHDVREFLGHAAIGTTSRYLRASPLGLERAIARLDGTSAEESATNGPHDKAASDGEAPKADRNVMRH
jgi:integrase